MTSETLPQRSDRIIAQLKEKYPNCQAYDMGGLGNHFVCEVEPVSQHPEYDRAIEVIISSKPHKHLRMTQKYTIISGTLELHVADKVIILNPGDKYTIEPGNVHWAKSNDECWVEIYSEPGWTQTDHIAVDLDTK